MRALLLTLIAALVAAIALVPPPATATKDGKKSKSDNFPQTIALPNGWRPEGIAAGPGTSLFVGSIPTGSIFKADARTGEGAPFITRTGRAAIGIKFDDNRIYVAGGPTGHAFVYDATTGADVADVTLTTAPTTFVNDVTLTDDFAYFTDSRQQQLYRVDRETFAATTIPITGDLQYDADPGNNEANGIVALNQKTLIVVNSASQQLYTVNAATGASKLLQIAGGPFEAGDGLLLHGRTLFVVQNRLNTIAVVNLKKRRVERRITDDDFDVPTTITKQAGALYAPNARFGTATPTPDTATYDVVRVDGAFGKKHHGKRKRR